MACKYGVCVRGDGEGCVGGWGGVCGGMVRVHVWMVVWGWGGCVWGWVCV